MTQTATRTRTNTRKSSKPNYEPVALARCYDKNTGECLGYRAPSSDTSKDWYHITCDDNARWHCDCEAGQHNQLCCHVRAVQEQCKARHELGLPGCKEPTPGTNDSYSLPESPLDSDDQPMLDAVLALLDMPEESIDQEANWQEWMDELNSDSRKQDVELAPLHNSRGFSLEKQ